MSPAVQVPLGSKSSKSTDSLKQEFGEWVMRFNGRKYTSVFNSLFLDFCLPTTDSRFGAYITFGITAFHSQMVVSVIEDHGLVFLRIYLGCFLGIIQVCGI